MKIRDLTALDIGAAVAVDGRGGFLVTGIRITGSPDLVLEYEVEWWANDFAYSSTFEAWRVAPRVEDAPRVVLRLSEAVA